MFSVFEILIAEMGMTFQERYIVVRPMYVVQIKTNLWVVIAHVMQSVRTGVCLLQKRHLKKKSNTYIRDWNTLL